jgi:hypothetical protein
MLLSARHAQPARSPGTRTQLRRRACCLAREDMPGFPVLLEQRRSALTGAPIRCVALPLRGILGGGGGLLGAPLPSLAGARCLLLDDTSAVASVFHPAAPGVLTGAYWDTIAALEPLLPRGGVLAILGLAGGTAACIAHAHAPGRALLGWELDADVVAVARQHMGLGALEAVGALRIITGDALVATPPPGEQAFAGLFVDLFADGLLLPALREEATWRRWLAQLAPRGRLLVNLAGGSGDDAEQALTQAAFDALAAACGGELSLWEPSDEACAVQNVLALTGPVPDAAAWQAALPPPLRHLARGWRDARTAPE